MRKLAAIVLFLVPLTAQASDQSTLARNYLRARCATPVQGATEADVDKVVTLLAEDVVVQHPRANAVVNGRDAVRRGMSSHLSSYTGTSEDSGIELLSIVEAPGVVVMKTRTTFLAGEGEKRREISREGVTVAEIDGGRIKRLIEY